jgi:hypothetical protein
MCTRPLPVTVAAILTALISLASLPGPLLPGAEEIPASSIMGVWCWESWASSAPSDCGC